MATNRQNAETYPANDIPRHVLGTQEQQLGDVGVGPSAIVGGNGGGGPRGSSGVGGRTAGRQRRPRIGGGGGGARARAGGRRGERGERRGGGETGGRGDDGGGEGGGRSGAGDAGSSGRDGGGARGRWGDWDGRGRGGGRAGSRGGAVDGGGGGGSRRGSGRTTEEAEPRDIDPAGLQVLTGTEVLVLVVGPVAAHVIPVLLAPLDTEDLAGGASKVAPRAEADTSDDEAHPGGGEVGRDGDFLKEKKIAATAAEEKNGRGRSARRRDGGRRQRQRWKLLKKRREGWEASYESAGGEKSEPLRVENGNILRTACLASRSFVLTSERPPKGTRG